MSDWKEFKHDAENFEMPDIGGIDGSVVQLILMVIIALWLFRKMKGIFFLFMFAVGIYYFLHLG